MANYPQYYYIASGVGNSPYKLVAFDNALIQAGVSNYNLLKVSSILPSYCVEKQKVNLKYGSPLLAAFATVSSDEPGKRIATAIAVGIPADLNDVGIIMEATGETREETENLVRCMVMSAMQNHQIQIKQIKSSSTAGIVTNGWLSLISVIALW